MTVAQRRAEGMTTAMVVEQRFAHIRASRDNALAPNGSGVDRFDRAVFCRRHSPVFGVEGRALLFDSRRRGCGEGGHLFDPPTLECCNLGFRHFCIPQKKAAKFNDHDGAGATPGETVPEWAMGPDSRHPLHCSDLTRFEDCRMVQSARRDFQKAALTSTPYWRGAPQLTKRAPKLSDELI